MAKKRMSCGGSMTKYKKGGSAIKPFAAGIPYAAGAGQTDGKIGTMKKGGSIKIKKKYQEGGSAMITNTTPGEISPPMKKGGSVKKAKLAALAAPKNKITRADIIVGAKKKANKKK